MFKITANQYGRSGKHPVLRQNQMCQKNSNDAGLLIQQKKQQRH